MSTSSTSGFLGNSSFSTDFQNVITRAVKIASLPISQLQNQQGHLATQQAGLQSLGNQFQTLQNALTAIDTAVGAGSLAASVDTPAVARASVGSGALAGNYSIKISSLGSQTNTISDDTLPGVADPSTGNISSSTAFSLAVDGKTFSLTPAGNSLNSLVQAINTSGANVQATVVNVGGSTPSYRLSIQGTQLEPTTIQLNDGSKDLLNTLTAGSYVTYQVNGQPSTPATSTSRTLSISTGLTVTALQTGSANISIAQSPGTVQNSLASFISGFNAAVDEINKSRGQNGGPLTGQTVIGQLTGVLRNLTNFYSSTSGSIHTVGDLGISFDSNGHLQLDSSTFSSLASSSLGSVQSFLGSVSGGGFLAAAKSALSGVTNSTTGMITTATESIGTSIKNLTKKISDEQSRVGLMQKNLASQMAKADSTVSSLQQKVSQITNLFASMTQASKNITG